MSLGDISQRRVGKHPEVGHGPARPRPAWRVERGKEAFFLTLETPAGFGFQNVLRGSKTRSRDSWPSEIGQGPPQLHLPPPSHSALA